MRPRPNCRSGRTKCKSSTATSWSLNRRKPPTFPRAHPSSPCLNRKPIIRRAKDSLMAISNDLKPLPPRNYLPRTLRQQLPPTKSPKVRETPKQSLVSPREKTPTPQSSIRRTEPQRACRILKNTNRSSKSFELPRPSKPFRHAGTIGSVSTRSPSGSLAPSPSPL